MTTHELLPPIRQRPLPGTGRLGVVAAYFTLAGLGTGAITVFTAKSFLLTAWHGGFDSGAALASPGSDDNPSIRTLLGPGTYRELMEPIDDEVAEEMRALVEERGAGATKLNPPFRTERLQRCQRVID